VRFALMTEPQQGLRYEELLAIVRAAEEVGFESFFRSDHYTSFPGESGLPAGDAWSTLAGLARETSRITLGTLVSPVTFRHAGNLAKVVATVDEMSGGRVEVGVGAGWNDQEHLQLGLRFPPITERFELLEETVAILHGLWSEPTGFSFEGRFHVLRDARFSPTPVPREGRAHPNLILGGSGKPRAARLAARFADEYNVVSADPARVGEVYARIDEACRAEGRDPAEVVRSAMTGALIAETESELRDRVADQLRQFGQSEDDAAGWLEERRRRWVMGTPEQAWDRVRALERAGVQRVMLQTFIPRDLEHVRLLGRVFLG
jgi:alkanesulfonate monooxygenase